MGKHLVDIDEYALGAARAQLGTATIKDTVNEALRLAMHGRHDEVVAAFAALATVSEVDRADAWR